MSMDSNIDALLGSDELEDIQLVPLGSWKSELLSVTRKAPKNPEDANYKYRYTLTWEPQEPGEDVDEAEATAFMESDDFDGARVFQTKFVHNKRDILRLKRLLELAGYDGSIEDAREEIKGGYWALIDVTHEPDQNGDDREAVAGVGSVD